MFALRTRNSCGCPSCKDTYFYYCKDGQSRPDPKLSQMFYKYEEAEKKMDELGKLHGRPYEVVKIIINNLCDFDKLPAAPWQTCGASEGNCVCNLVWSRPEDCVIAHSVSSKDEDFTCGQGCDEETSKHVCKFIADARNVEDILKRRRWGLVPPTKDNTVKWRVWAISPSLDAWASADHDFNHPFTAILEAEKWYVENIENKKPQPILEYQI